MPQDFAHTTFGTSPLPILRLGLSASYRPGKAAIYRAIDEGINFFFCYGFDTQMTSVLRDVLKRAREKYIVCSGAYNLYWGHPNIRRSLEKRLRQLGTEYIDAFLFLGTTKKHEYTSAVSEELARLRGEGKVSAIGLSGHDRKYVGGLAEKGQLDVAMVRYNAAHRGAEQEIFPFVRNGRPFIVSYTATRWTYLLRRPRTVPKGDRIPSAGEAYRFVLSHPAVNVVLTAPRTMNELGQNIAALRQGPLGNEEMTFMRQFGDAVHAATQRGFK